MAYRVGYAAVDITPDIASPVFLAGFGQNRRARSVHDPLYARALALCSEQDSPEQALILCAVDLIGLGREDVYDVIRTYQQSHPSAQVIQAATHTHHGPDTIGLWGPDTKTSGVDQAYLSELKEKLVDVLVQATRTMHPARFKSAVVNVPGLVRNTRDPEVIDDELTLAQWIDIETGRPLATLVNFPCHPEVLWEDNTSLTADYPAAVCRAVEDATGASCLFFSGAFGGMLTPDVADHTFEEAEAMGQRLADEGLAALEIIPSRPFQSISVAHREIRVRLMNPLFWLARLRKLLPLAGLSRTGMLTTEVNLVKIEDLWLATVPGELSPWLGLALKARMRQAGAQVTGIIGLANDELGYLLPDDGYHYPINPLNPGAHYEETMSISRGIGPRVIESLMELIENPLEPGSE